MTCRTPLSTLDEWLDVRRWVYVLCDTLSDLFPAVSWLMLTSACVSFFRQMRLAVVCLFAAVTLVALVRAEESPIGGREDEFNDTLQRFLRVHRQSAAMVLKASEVLEASAHQLARMAQATVKPVEARASEAKEATATPALQRFIGVYREATTMLLEASEAFEASTRQFARSSQPATLATLQAMGKPFVERASAAAPAAPAEEAATPARTVLSKEERSLFAWFFTLLMIMISVFMWCIGMIGTAILERVRHGCRVCRAHRLIEQRVQRCVVCLDSASNMAFVPCGHVCCCAQCATNVAACPLCRKLLDRKLRVYLS